jgi:hypothetical protein
MLFIFHQKSGAPAKYVRPKTLYNYKYLSAFFLHGIKIL